MNLFNYKRLLNTNIMAENIASPLMSLPHECELTDENGQYALGEEMDPVEQEDSNKRLRGSRKGVYEKRKVVIKEGFLLKHSKTALKKGTYRNFKLYKDVLFYSRLKDETMSNRIEIIGASIAERGTRNSSHTFSVISEALTLILSAENRRDMEDWIRKMRSCAEKRIEKEDLNVTQTLSGLHNWYLATHNRPIFCSKCKEVLHGTNYRGVSCEVCGINAHQNCASGIAQACKWTTRESMIRDGVKLEENSFDQPHQWQEGNLPNNSKCMMCKKQCGSKKALQDWYCIWCRACCHEGCRAKIFEPCNFGRHGKLIVPATAAVEDSCELSWKILETSFLSIPFLAYVNSRSGDNQGVKFVRHLRNLLNPLQVVDLGVKTPESALEVYRVCEMFYILACGGDGTVGWILQCLDKYGLHDKVTTCVVPLGTGNDLSRVLGWGAACNDDLKLDGILDDLQKCSIRNLDRWSVCKGPMMLPSVKRRARTKAMESSPSPTRKISNVTEKADDLLPETENIPNRLAMRRRSSSTGDLYLGNVNNRSIFKKAVSLLQINIPEDEGPVPISHEVTFGFKESNSEEFHASEKLESTSTAPNMLFTAPSIDQDEVNDVEGELANQITTLFGSIVRDYPNPEMMDLASASSLCIMLQAWVNDFLKLMRERMLPHEIDVNLTATKANELLTGLPILINSIAKLSKNKAKSFLSETEILVRTSCFVLVAHSTDIKRLDVAEKSQFISLLFGLLLKATQATDYKTFKAMMTKAFKESEGDGVKPKKDLAEIKDIATMNNYIGVGLDAKIALDFHNLREEHPESCKTRSQNKMWYGIFTGRQMISQEFKTLSKRLILECDGEEIELPQLQGIVLLNIPSYMAGTNFWGTDKESGVFNAPSIDDKKLEVIAVMGTTHMAESKVFGVQRHRLAQAETIKLTIRGPQPVPIQVDGEAWLQDPGVVLIRHKNKARMFVRDKKKILVLSDPQIISRNFTHSSFGRSVSLTNVLITDLIEATEGLLGVLKSLIQSKGSEVQLVDKDLFVVFQKVSLTMLNVYGQDGMVISQGMHKKQGEIIESAKALLKETLLYLAISNTSDEDRTLIQEGQKPVVKFLKTLMN